MLEHIQKITIEKPVDKIITQIREQIATGEIRPGDKLPPERKLAEHFGVGRAHVRDAIRKLEFYGILKTLPQSGTVVSGTGVGALKGVISDYIKLDDHDFRSLVETRVLLEKEAACLAALKRTEEDIVELQNAFDAYQSNVEKGLPAIEEDLKFHVKIADAGKNKVLKALMMIISPDIVSSFNKFKVCNDGTIDKSLEEHRIIMQHIKNQEPELAASAMESHLQDVLAFSRGASFMKTGS